MRTHSFLRRPYTPAVCLVLLVLFGFADLQARAQIRKPSHVILFVIDGFSYKAWDKLSVPTLRRLAREGVLVAQDYLPPPAHPKTGAYAELHTASVANPIMMAGSIFINERTVYLQQAIAHPLTSAFVVNSTAYVTLSGGYDHVFQQDGPDEIAVANALEIMQQHRPSFVRIHLQNAGSAGFQCLSTDRNVEWRGNIWASSSPYRLATERADSLLDVFIRGLRDAGVLDSTAVIVVGDHGQDDGGWHPLELPDGAISSIVLWGTGINRGVQISYAEHIDIVPTVCMLLQIAPPATSIGRPIVEAIAGYDGPVPPRPHTIREFNNVLSDFRHLSTELAWELEKPDAPRRGFYFYQLGLLRQSFMDLNRFVEWGEHGTLDSLLAANKKALSGVTELMNRFSEESRR